MDMTTKTHAASDVLRIHEKEENGDKSWHPHSTTMAKKKENDDVSVEKFKTYMHLISVYRN